MLGSATPADPSTTSASPPTAISESSLSTASISLGLNARTVEVAHLTMADGPSLKVRQASTSSTTTPGSQTTGMMSSAAATPTIIATTPETLYEVGQFQCTSSVDLGFVGHILSDYFSATGYNTNATVAFLVLNLHTAANPSGSNSVLEETHLPSPGNYVADVLNSTLFSYMYTPEVLQTDRSNLNNSWYAANTRYQPDRAYIDTHRLPSGNVETYGGWPSEGYLEFYQFKRLLIGYGTVDSQISGYNVTLDGQTIFPPGYLSAADIVLQTPPGSVSSGCFFNANVTSISSTNNSFATTENEFTPASQTDFTTLLAESNNASSCGASPLLNQTLFNTTAGANATAYSYFVGSTIWSWYEGQPYDMASTGSSTPGDHCAVMNLTSFGKWHATSCNDRHYAACRIGSQPYLWTPSQQSGPYDAVSRVCPDNSTFSVPRTALENAYLVSAMQSAHNSGDLDSDETLIWVNFNDLDVSGCWVSGANNTCPYVQRTSTTGRKVTVPTVAAVIVFVIAALTVFVKCAANRGASRKRRNRRRRGDSGWDYEGVPS